MESGDGYNRKYPSGIIFPGDVYNRQYTLDIISLCDGYNRKYPLGANAISLIKWLASAVVAKVRLPSTPRRWALTRPAATTLIGEAHRQGGGPSPGRLPTEEAGHRHAGRIQERRSLVRSAAAKTEEEGPR